MNPLKIAFCIPTLGRPHMATWNSFNNLIKPRASGDLIGESHLITIEDRPVDNARLLATQQALAVPGLTHILWIDDDMTFPPDALQRLLAHDKGVIGGLCHNRRAPSYQPIAARRYHPDLGMPQGAYGFVYDLPQSGVVEVDATGGAFLLVKAEVFREISAKFGEGSWWVPEGEASEDFSFCRRAQACGFKIHIDCGLDIGHFGTVEIHRKQANALRSFKTAPWMRYEPNAAEGKPQVTVVIPTYNQKPAYLKAAVLSALNQTVPTEVIVVDDGTTDYDLRDGGETGRLPELSAGHGWSRVDMNTGDEKPVVYISKRAKLIKHDKNRGISAALNTGIAHMTTDYFCWLSSDDLFSPTKVEHQLNAMIASGAKASFHDYTVIDNRPGSFGRYVYGQNWSSIDQQMRALREACCINGSTVMLHKDLLPRLPKADFKKAIPVTRNDELCCTVYFREPVFDPDLRFAQDWEMWLRVAQNHLWHRVPESLGMRREGENLTAQIANSPADDARRLRRDEEDRIVRERYADRRFVAVNRGLAIEVLGTYRTYAEATTAQPAAFEIIEIFL